MALLNTPSNNDPLGLFVYSINRVLTLGLMNERKSHQGWANCIFHNEKKAHVRCELMSIVKSEYSSYFDDQLHYMFLEEKIRNNFPHLFGVEQSKDIFDRILQALDAEFEEQKNPKNRKSFKVDDCEKISNPDGVFLYRAQLFIEDGDDPRFTEAMPFEFRTVDNTYYCEVVEFDYANGILFFTCDKDIYYTYNSRVYSDASMNIKALVNLIQDISEQNIDKDIPLYKFLNGKTENLTLLSHSPVPSYIEVLMGKDTSQYKAFNASLDKDITFIWGPPGTGKTFTLAAIIMALHKMESERTAVCCLSNVAVDQLVNKVVDLIEEHEPNMPRGEFYRAGRSQDERVIATEFLFPDDNVSTSLRTKIKFYNVRLDNFRKNHKQYTEEAIKIKARLKETREALKEHTDYLISKVKVVFSTISNFVINSKLKDGKYDNLIVDEASMLALPQLIALSRKVVKRIILVGDFQQLPPITLSNIPVLSTNVFKLCDIDINHIEHPALHQLLNQRRSNPMLVELINNSFYNGRLVAMNNKNSPIVARAPYNGCVVGMYRVSGAVRFTKGGTRQNEANANAVIELLDIYSQDDEETYSIGIITPYAGQAALLKALFIKRNYSLDFQYRVRIGTVHTFQGSESDVIIFDMVDSLKFEKGNKVYPGKIYAGSQGEQLMNVAISRARHKLIVVCDPEYLNNCPGGQLSTRTKHIFKNLLKARMTKL